jgi:hypothetical protein
MRRYLPSELIAGIIVACIAIVGLASIGLKLLAQESPRHIDFTQVLKDLDGKPLPVNPDGKLPAPATLGYVAKEALVNALQGDPPEGSAKFDHWQLAAKVYPDKSDVVLTAEEIATIKERIGKGFPALVVGPAWRLLDPAVSPARVAERTQQR